MLSVGVRVSFFLPPHIKLNFFLFTTWFPREARWYAKFSGESCSSNVSTQFRKYSATSKARQWQMFSALIFVRVFSAPCFVKAFNNNLSHVLAINADHFYSTKFLFALTLAAIHPKMVWTLPKLFCALRRSLLALKSLKKNGTECDKSEKHLKKLWRNISRDGRQIIWFPFFLFSDSDHSCRGALLLAKALHQTISLNHIPFYSSGCAFPASLFLPLSGS